MAKYGIFLTPDRHHIVAMKTTTADPADGDWDNQGNAIVLNSYGCESPIKSMWAVASNDIIARMYFFDTSDAGPTDPGAAWSNDANAFDGDSATSAVTTTSGSSGSNYLEGEGTEAPASDGPTLANATISLAIHMAGGGTCTAGFRVTTNAAAETLVDSTFAINGSNLIHRVALSLPSGGWTYAKIQALEIRHWRDSGSASLNIFDAWIEVIIDGIAVATQQESGRVAFHAFNLTDDDWDIVDETVAVVDGTTSFDNVPELPAVSLALRDDGDVVVVAAYADATNETLRAFTKQDGTWVNEGEATGAVASTDYYGVSVVGPDSSDRISWIYKDHTNSDVDTRSIQSDNTINSAVTVDATAVDTAKLLVAPGVMDGNIIYFPYIGINDDVSVATWTSADSPTVALKADVSDSNVLGHGGASAGYDVTSGGTDEGVGRVATNNTKVAQSFTPTQNVTKITGIEIILSKNGTPTDNVLLHIETDSSGEPSGTQVGNQIIVVDAATLPSTGSILNKGPDIDVILEDSVRYWFVLTRSGSLDDSNYANWFVATSSSVSGESYATFNGTSWSVQAANDGTGVLVFNEISVVSCLSIGDATSDISLLYVEDTTFDIQHDDDATVAGGGTETELEAGSVSHISARKGTSDINYFFRDVGTTKFGAHSFAAPAGLPPGMMMMVGVGR